MCVRAGSESTRAAFTICRPSSRYFPHQKGINGGSEVPGQLVLAYDTRDSLEVPRKGGLAQIYFGVADRAFLSSVSYTRFGGELRRYYAINDKVTLAGHVFVEYNPSGDETPFWSMARLGGQESLLTDQETFADMARADTSITVWRWPTPRSEPGYGITTSSGPTEFWNIAPFLDIRSRRAYHRFQPAVRFAHGRRRSDFAGSRSRSWSASSMSAIRRRRRRAVILRHQLAPAL